MDNPYVHGLKQYDSRPRSPVVVPHDMSALRKKILFENTLLEERTLHEFSAGKGDGAGIDTGSAPLKPLTSPTPSPTPTPTPAPAGIVVATTNTLRAQIASLGFDDTFSKNEYGYFNGTDCSSEDNPNTNSVYFQSGFWIMSLPCSGGLLIRAPGSSDSIIPLTGWTNVYAGDTPVNVVFTVLS